jgi:hypothetical protein
VKREELIRAINLAADEGDEATVLELSNLLSRAEAPVKEEPQGPMYRGLAEEARGLGEVGLSLGTGAVAAPIAGLAGIAGTLLPGPEGQGARWTEGVQQALTYEPRGFVGQRTLGAVAAPFEQFERFADWAGEVSGDPGDVLGATAVKTGILAAPSLLGLRGKRPEPIKAPSAGELRAASTQLYETAHNAGIQVAPRAIARMMDEIETRARQAGLDTRPEATTLSQHPQALAAMQRLRREANSGQPMSLREIDTLRQSIGDIAASADRGTARIGRVMQQALDDMLDAVGPGDVLGGADPRLAITFLDDARSLWKRQAKHDTVQKMWRDAETRMDSPAGFEAALRNEAKKLARNENQLRRFSPEERQIIRDFAVGGPGERFLRIVGKGAPRTLMGGALAMGGGTAIAGGNPLGGALLAAGLEAARQGSAAMTRGHYHRLSETVRGGKPRPAGPDPAYSRTMKGAAATEALLESGEHYNGILEE